MASHRLLPVLNRSQPIGDTSRVSFKTVRPCIPTRKSHIDQVVADTDTWEQAATFRLEQSPVVASYARNDHLELSVHTSFSERRTRISRTSSCA